jgi:hypothetical protein
MAKRSGLSQTLITHGVNVSGDVGSINNLTLTRADLDTTGLDKTAHERLTGTGDGSIDFTSFFNDEVAGSHLTLRAMPATSVMWTWLLAGAEAGGAGMTGTVQQMSYSPVRGRNGSMEIGVVGSARDGYPPFEDHVNVSPGIVTHASATSSASIDSLASSALGGIGFLQYTSRASGTPTFLIEHSTNNSTWATLLTFVGTGGVTSFGERLTVTGTVNRYLRATTTGTFTNAVFWIGFRRGILNDITSYA